jgi:predicted nucleic acid-binding protein
LLDSWCWVEFFNGTIIGKKVAEYIDSDKPVFISVINLAEVYKQGLMKKSKSQADEMVAFMMNRCFIIPVEPEMALNAAKLNAETRIGLGDSLIYTSAKAHNLTLVTGDQHFKNMKGVVYLGK